MPYPFNQSLLSCEEGEDDKEKEVPHLSWHPKPLGVSADVEVHWFVLTVGLCCCFNRSFSQQSSQRKLSGFVYSKLWGFFVCFVAVHVWMPDTGLQQLHLRPPLATSAACSQCHVGAARQHTSVEVSVSTYQNKAADSQTSQRLSNAMCTF